MASVCVRMCVRLPLPPPFTPPPHLPHLLVWLQQTLFKEGVKGIYKGFSAPLATVALFNAVLFASRGQMEVLLRHKDGERVWGVCVG